MTFMVVNFELVPDQASHPRASPQRRRKAVRLGTFQQQRYQPFPLRGCQQRLAPGASGAAQRGRALLLVLPPPLTEGGGGLALPALPPRPQHLVAPQTSEHLYLGACHFVFSSP